MNVLKIVFLFLFLGFSVSGEDFRTVILKGNADSGRKVQLVPGQCVQWILESNPTTGYDWEFFLSLSDSVELVNNEFRPANNGLCGAGGLRVITLKGRKKGSARLLGFYRRRWEKFDPAAGSHCLLNIDVKGSR